MAGNPCEACGACCATWRVSFHEDEVSGAPGGLVPAGLVEPVSATAVCMRGTADQPPRCIALRGQIGIAVKCAIYEFRPSPCREFSPMACIGQGEVACDEARRRHGLPPLEGRA